ncbi:MAG: DUF4878 domain-containing protein [Marinilabiliaceae bacterium]|nr:DUF4878 domain-containing protein [Marinilabiliaceae bacterium]
MKRALLIILICITTFTTLQGGRIVDMLRHRTPTAIVSAALDCLQKGQFATYLSYYGIPFSNNLDEMLNEISSKETNDIPTAVLQAALVMASELFTSYEIKKEEVIGDSAVVWVHFIYTDSSAISDRIGIPLMRNGKKWILDWPPIIPEDNN